MGSNILVTLNTIVLRNMISRNSFSQTVTAYNFKGKL